MRFEHEQIQHETHFPDSWGYSCWKGKTGPKKCWTLEPGEMYRINRGLQRDCNLQEQSPPNLPIFWGVHVGFSQSHVVMRWFLGRSSHVSVDVYITKQGLVNVPIEHHPTIGDIISSIYLKVMWNQSTKVETSIPSPAKARKRPWENSCWTLRDTPNVRQHQAAGYQVSWFMSPR